MCVKYASALEEKTTEMMGSVFPLTLVRNCLDLNQCNRKHSAGPAGWQKSCCPSLVTAAWEVDVKCEQAAQGGQGNHGWSQQELQVSPLCLHHPTLSQLSCSRQSSTPAKPAANSDCWRPLILSDLPVPMSARCLSGGTGGKSPVYTVYFRA